MNGSLSVWRGKSEWLEFARLISAIFARRFLGSELKLLRMAGILSDGNANRTDTACPVIPFPEPTGIGEAQTNQPKQCEIPRTFCSRNTHVQVKEPTTSPMKCADDRVEARAEGSNEETSRLGTKATHHQDNREQ
jgi:hypothetical protein